jgi:gamma-glutamylcyclotransferase (GGCT)/AIG2-like uncharacterized protein YtfP
MSKDGSRCFPLLPSVPGNIPIALHFCCGLLYTPRRKQQKLPLTDNCSPITAYRHAMTQLPFFVYGTLRPGQPNAYLWGDAIAQIETAWFENGRLYDCGPYPMLVEETAVVPVQGQLMIPHPDQYDDLLVRIDTLEGFDPEHPDEATYRRVRRPVLVGAEPGQYTRQAWAWVYIGRAEFVTDLSPIPSGNWAVHVTARQRQVNDWWQSIRSVAGLHRPADND